MLKQYSHIIFDFDRTIATIAMDWSGWHNGIAKVIQDFDRSFEQHRLSGMVYYAVQNEYIKRYGAPLAQALVAFIQEYEKEHLQGYIPISATVALIEKLKDRKLYIWSSNSRTTVERALKELSLSQRFTRLICREDVVYTKPNPEGFSLIKDPSIALEHYLFVGDNPAADQAAAAAAGIAYLDVNQL